MKKIIRIKTRYLVYVVVSLSVLIGFFSACSSSHGTDQKPDGGDGALSRVFWLEPGTQTTIGRDQAFNIYTAFKNSPSDPFPTYLDPTLVTWSLSSPGIITIGTDGVVMGVADGTSVVTAQYQTYSSQLTVSVGGRMIKRTVSVSGQNRDYELYIPTFTDTNPHPLVLSLHGGGGAAMEQAAKTRFNNLAQEKKFYVAYPEGSGAIQTFNGGSCCGYAQSHGVDDSLYIRAILDDLQSHYNVNASKIYSTGFSNGGIMSHRLACEVADRISGIAAVSGASGQYDRVLNKYYDCIPSRPIPILHIHAKNDRNYPYDGGTGAGASSTDYYSVSATVSDWLTRNNVTNQATTEVLSSFTKCYHYSTVANSSKASAPVVLCVENPPDVYDPIDQIVYGGGHSWPGGVRSYGIKSDIPPQDFDATSYIWNFLNH